MWLFEAHGKGLGLGLPCTPGQHRIPVQHGSDDKILPSTRRYHQHCKVMNAFKISLEKACTFAAKPTKKG